MKKLQLTPYLKVKDLQVLIRTSETRQGVQLVPLLEVLVSAMRQAKEVKGMWAGKEEIKVSLFTEDIIIHIQCPGICEKERERSEREKDNRTNK